MSGPGEFAEFLLWERSSRDTLEVKRAYVDMAGDLVAGVVLSQIVYWHLPNREGKPRLQVEREGKRWLAKGRAEWWEECRISPKQADRALEALEARGLIEVRLFRFAAAPTKHLRILHDEFLRAWKDVLAGQGTGRGPGPGGGGGGESDFDQRSKSISTKGRNPLSPKGEIHFDQRVKTLTETTTETTTAAARTAEPKLQPRDADAAGLEEELVKHGVGRAAARRFAEKKPDVCRRCLDYLPFADVRSSRGAWLANAIRDEYGPPKRYVEAAAAEKGRSEREKSDEARRSRTSRENSIRREQFARLGETLGRLEKEQGEAFLAFTAHLEEERRKAERMAAQLSHPRRAEYLASFDSGEHRLELFGRWMQASGTGSVAGRT